MPLARLALIRGKSPEYLAAVSDAIHDALVSDFAMPEDDRFQIITQHDANEMSFNRTFRGGPRSDDFMILSILGGPEPALKVKQAFFKKLVKNLGERANVAPEDVFVTLQSASAEDFSFGGGRSLLPDA